MALDELMDDVEEEVAKKLASTSSVRDVDVFPNVGQLRVGDDWVRMDGVVAVVADLKGSTRFSIGQYVNSTVLLYEAATGCGVKVASKFKPEFIDIQGDGFFCLFHGDNALRRGMAAAMSLAYFSREVLSPAISKFVGRDGPVTGLKVGVDVGRLAVGRVGVRGATELIWPGKPVNWAFKCSGAADSHQVVVTDRVYDRAVEPNEYLLRPCYVPGHHHGYRVWTPITVNALPDVNCAVRKTPWCPDVADTFCEAVFHGENKQPAKDLQRLRYYLNQ